MDVDSLLSRFEIFDSSFSLSFVSLCINFATAPPPPSPLLPSCVRFAWDFVSIFSLAVLSIFSLAKSDSGPRLCSAFSCSLLLLFGVYINLVGNNFIACGKCGGGVSISDSWLFSAVVDLLLEYLDLFPLYDKIKLISVRYGCGWSDASEFVVLFAHFTFSYVLAAVCCSCIVSMPFDKPWISSKMLSNSSGSWRSNSQNQEKNWILSTQAIPFRLQTSNQKNHSPPDQYWPHLYCSGTSVDYAVFVSLPIDYNHRMLWHYLRAIHRAAFRFYHPQLPQQWRRLMLMFFAYFSKVQKSTLVFHLLTLMTAPFHLNYPLEQSHCHRRRLSAVVEAATNYFF